ncbi:MAG TPA: alpha/beta hydrolase [Bryobacteraceae bacterium]|nr:alpha/beta hydrolase [Bryobacteraceae bacterium]
MRHVVEESTPASIFISPEAKTKLEAWHERFRKKLGIPTDSVRISTRLGPTHVLCCGPPDAPPLVCLHGAMGSSAHILAGATTLAKNFRLIAPDVPGQSPMSAETRPGINGQGYPEWLADVFDALQLEQTYLLGASWGGVIALRGAARIPERIGKISLLVPAGLIQGSLIQAFFRVGWPLMRYRSSPSAERRERFLRYLITTHDQDWEAYLGDAALAFKPHLERLALLKSDDLKTITAPVQLIAAEGDVQFPGAKLIARALRVVPNLKDTALIPHSRHVPPFTPEFYAWLSDRIVQFLSDTRPEAG